MNVSSKKPRKILVVDDDPVIRDMIVDILDFEGYATQVARHGREALDILTNSDEHYLVLLDLMMPVMDGQAFCRELNSNPKCRQRHVLVIMSAMDNLPLAAPLNVDATLPKPFSVDALLAIINSYLT